jgi:hypothetical protein
MKPQFSDYILLLCLWLQVGSVTAQARLGYTEAQIRHEFPFKYFRSGITTLGQHYIYFEDAKFTIAYYFNDDNVSSSCMLIPATRGYLNALVEQYNREFVIISETTWKMYSETGIIYVELVFEEKGKVHFEFTH